MVELSYIVDVQTQDSFSYLPNWSNSSGRLCTANTEQ